MGHRPPRTISCGCSSALGEALGFGWTPLGALPARAQKAILTATTAGARRNRNRYGRERPTRPAFEGVVPFLSGGTRRPTGYSRGKHEGYMREVPCPACGGRG